jgi:hypothetical protein|tara:strand:- start:4059 stop:5096 length:1038 start_codon:yes stop_codon:yes gene_type:complete
MDYNYTLKYRTFDQLLEDVTIDLNTFALENMIEPQQLIKLAKKINYDLGLRINQQKEVILHVTHGKIKLPDDFYTFNFAFICGDRGFQRTLGYDGHAAGTTMKEVPITTGTLPVTYSDFPSSVPDACATTTPTCCCDTKGNAGTCLVHDPALPYGDANVKPRVFMNCKGNVNELIQVISSSETLIYKELLPLRMKASQGIECHCPNLYYNTSNEGWIKHGFLYTTFQTGKVYLNYQGQMEDDDGNLLVPDHDLLNEYYEYAFKARILENLYINGEDVAQRMQLVEQRLRGARNNALSVVNTPNFAELKQIHQANRKAMYGRYYDMFMSHSPNSGFHSAQNKLRVI